MCRSNALTLAVSALAATSILGCATAPESFVGGTLEPQSDTYTCVVREINELEFRITNADRDAGFVAAEKQTSGLGTALLTGRKYYDQLSVSIFQAETGGKTTIRVTVGQGESGSGLFSNASRSDMNKPSNSGRAAARAILAACGDGEVAAPSGADGYQIEATVR